MNIAVYCASTDGNRPAFREAAYRLGHWIGSSGHTLVYGGASKGLMGIVADAALEAGGEVIGVLPNVPEILARRHTGLTRVIETADMADRRRQMIELSDACVALPGGPGTLDEVSEILALIRLHLYPKPCVLYSPDNYWEPLSVMLGRMEECGYCRKEELPGVLVSGSLKEIIPFLTGKSSVEKQD